MGYAFGDGCVEEMFVEAREIWDEEFATGYLDCSDAFGWSDDQFFFAESICDGFYEGGYG